MTYIDGRDVLVASPLRSPVLGRAVAPAASPPLSALPVPVDLQLYQGDDFFLDLTVTDPGTGTAADLTGAVATAQIRVAPTSDTILATFTATIEGNVIHLHLPHEESSNLALAGVWDCQIETGVVTTLAAGRVTVVLEVTR